MRSFSRLSALVGASLLAQSAMLEASGSGPRYTATAIGAVGTKSIGWDINDSGHVVGQMQFGSYSQAFLYANGSVTSLGTLGGNTSVAYGINNAGQIVGQSATSGGGGLTAFFYSDGAMTNLGMPGDSTQSPITASAATDINDAGQAVMWSRHQNGSHSSFIYHSAGANPSLEAIPFQGRASVRAVGINNHGVVTGETWRRDNLFENSGAPMPFRYESGGLITDLGRLSHNGKEALSGSAYGINDHGVVIGANLVESGVFNGFISDPAIGSLQRITPLPGVDQQWSDSVSAWDINNSGQIVGGSDVWVNSDGPYDTEREEHAFLIHDGAIWDLNNRVESGAPEGVIFHTAYGINNWGQIVAQGTSGSGSSRIDQAYLLNPLSFVTSMTEEEGRTTLNIKAIQGMNYSAYEAPEAPEGSFSVALLGGEAGGQRDVEITYTGEGAPGVLGEVIRLTGTEDDLFVLQLGYDPALEDVLNPELLALGWLDPEDGIWKNAVEGNDGGTPMFILGAFDPQYLQLGYYGVDIENHHVWAVLNHNSDYGVIPEPSTWVCLLLGGVGLVIWSRRQRRCHAG